MGSLGNLLFLPPVSIGELELQTLLFFGVCVLKLQSSNLQGSPLSIETSLQPCVASARFHFIIFSLFRNSKIHHSQSKSHCCWLLFLFYSQKMKAFICMHLRSNIKVALSGRKSTPSASWGLEKSAENALLLFLAPVVSLPLRTVDLFVFCFSFFLGGVLLLLCF